MSFFPRKQLVPTALGAAGVVLLVAIFILVQRNTAKLLETPNTPQDQWQRSLRTGAQGDRVRIENAYDGYAILVPASWQIPQTASGTSGLSVFYHPLGRAPQGSDVPEGLFLKISVEQKPPGAPLADWASEYVGDRVSQSVQLAGYTALHIVRPILGYDENFNTVATPKTQESMYFIEREGKVFVLSCSAQGDQYEEWVALCEEQLTSFTLLK